MRSDIHGQSQALNRGVERQKDEDQGAGDQGMMFGYACKETPDYMPLTIVLSHMLLMELAKIRREGKKMKYLRPDAKSQVTVEYGNNWKPLRIDTIVISTQHDEFMDDDAAMIEKIEHDVRTILLPRVKKLLPQRVRNLFKADMKLFVNPTGKFVIGGPHGDTGLTGRKIIVDTYGGRGAHGGGAFSGKDGFYVNTYGTAHVKDANGKKMNDAEIAEKIKELFDLRPYAIVKRFGLKNPIFEPTASYGHFGRDYYTAKVEVMYKDKDTFTENGKNYKNVEFFAWEKLDMVEKIQKVFSI